MQKELFNEFEAPKKRVKKKDSGSILPKNYILFNVSYEQVVFISIGVIMLMVLVFSLGVERGKGLNPEQAKASVNLPKTTSGIIEGIDKDKKIKEGEAAPPVTLVKKERPIAQRTEPKIPVLADVKKPIRSDLFTVQVIAYKSKRSAQKELVKLGKKGYSPFIILGGGYYQICVGEYKSRKEANKALSDLKKSHPGSFLRKR
ncbi:MAG: SPOR domain-containing protein [Candidatus Omnitrophota bacterium]